MTGAEAQTSTVQFSSDTFTIPEGTTGGAAWQSQRGLNLFATTGNSPGGAILLITATDGTAVIGTDYRLILSSNDRSHAVWGNETNPATIFFLTSANNDDASDKSFTVTMTIDSTYGGGSFTLGSRTTTTVVIRDNDPTIATLSRVGSGAVSEGDKVEFTVTLGRALVAGEIVDVPLSISGTGVTVADWSLATKSGSSNTGVTVREANPRTATPTVRFSGAGAQTATLELTATSDTSAESSETFIIALGNNAAFDAASLGTNVGGGADPHASANSFNVRVDNRAAGSFVFTPESVQVLEGESATFTVALGSAPTGDVGVTTSVVGELTRNPIALSFTPQNWSEPQTVTLTAGHDVDGTDDTLSILFIAVGGGYDGVRQSLPVTVRDDDVASLVFSTSSLSVMEGGSKTYTVRLGMMPSGPVTVTPTRAGSSHVSFSPATLTFNASGSTKLWNVPQTVTVRASHDGDLDDETATIAHSASGGGYGSVSGTVRVAVVDDDAASDCTNCVWITAGGTGSITEGQTAEFVLRANPAPGRDLDVRVVVADAGGRGLSHFVSGRNQGFRTVTIPRGQSATIFEVPTLGDTTDEPDGAVWAQARDVDGGYRVRPGSGQFGYHPEARVTVLDDDAAPDRTRAENVSFDLSTTSIREDAADRWVNVDVELSRALNFPAAQLDYAVCVYSTARRSKNMSQTGANGYDYRVWGKDAYGNEAILTAVCPGGRFSRWETRSRLRIEVLDDSHEDSGETIRMVLQRMFSERWEELGIGLTGPLSRTLVILNDEGGTRPAGHPLMKYAALAADIRDVYIRDHDNDGAHTRWKRVLKGLGDPAYAAYSQAAMTAAEARDLYDTHNWARWAPVGAALAYAEAYFSGTTVQPPASGPEVTIAAGDGVTEGTAATFTLTADPAPSAPLDVSVTVATDGDYGITAGTQTVTIPTSGSATLTLATTGDEADEADGSVSVTVAAGTGYTVGSDSSGTVAIADDDPAPETGAHPAVDPALIAQIREWMAIPSANAAARNERFTRVLAAFGVESHANPMTIAEAEGYVRRGWRGRWQPIVDALKAIEAYVAPPPASGPEVTIAAGDGVTEGTSATFTLTADPAPTAALDVSVTVATDGDYGIAAGTQTVTIPTSGSATLTLATTGDDADEPDGSVSVTVDAGTGYTVGSASSGSVAIADDDPPALAAAHPVVKYAALVKSFYDRLTARQQHGDGASGGWNKRFLKAMGHPEYVDYPQAAVTVADATRVWNHGGPGANTAWDGTVEAVTYAEQYFAGQTTTPDPAADPEVTIAAGSGVTEGTSATFTLTADPAPTAALDVTVTVATDGDYGITAGTQTVTIPTTGSATLTLATTGDEVDEADGSVSVTVDAGTGYTVGSASSGTVAIADDDAPATPDPEVTIAAGSGVTEGTAATFTLTADPAPAAALQVTVTVAASGDYGITAGERTVTIPTSGSYVLTLATTGDDADEADGSVSVTVDAGTGYTVGAASSGTVAIADDDLPPPEISVAAKAASITEGGNAVFTVTADRAVDADLAVTLTVSEKAGPGSGSGTSSDFVAAADEGGKTVTVLKGETEATLTVKTDDDAVDEPDGSVSATVDAGDGYTVASSPDDAASVAVADNDVAAAGPPAISVEDVTVQEGGVAVIPVTLSPAPTKPVRLFYRTMGAPVGSEGYASFADYRSTRAFLHFKPGETLKHARVRTKQDSHDDGGEVFEVLVMPAGGNAVPAAGVYATVTIENDDPMPGAYLARFGRTVAEQALDGIAGRMSADRTPGMQGSVAGQAMSFDPAAFGQPAAVGATPGATGTSGTMPVDRQAALAMAGIARGLGADASDPAGPRSAFPGSLSGAGGAGPGSNADPFGVGFDRPQAQSRTMTARDALLGSSFSLTGQRDGAGGSLAFWGRASQNSFDGADRGDGTDIRLDGTVTTGMLGADYARGNWLIGLALTQSSSEGKYAAIGAPADAETGADDGAVRAGDGDVEASLTAAIPYAALRASERLKLWGAAGYGTGEVTLKTMGESYSADTSWTMAAAGVRGDLLEAPQEGSGPALALTSDALWARTSSDKTGELNATDSDATRLRLGLEGSYRIAMESLSRAGRGNGASLVPKLEIGARHDGGDAETGFGVEVGGGIAWVDPSLGLSLDVSGRTLLAHENDDLKDRGFSAALGFDPAPATQRGPSLSLRQDFGGQAQGGLDALFVNDPLEDRAGSEAASRWAMEAAYGLPVFGDRFTGSPHVGFGLATGARDYSFGWRLTPEAATAPDLSFGIRATRRESDAAEAEHTVGFEIRARW